MALDFKIGEFRERIVLQRQVAEQSSTGAVVKRWVDHKTVFAKTELVSTGEAVRDGGRMANMSTYKVTTYAMPEVDSSFRALWRGKAYEIIAVEPIRYVYAELTIVG